MQFIAPREAYEITNFPTALYIQVLFGLRTSIKSILSGFCPTVLAAFNILKQEWEQMANDIRNGTLKSSLKLTDSQRSALEEAMGGGDPQRADEIVKIMCQSDFKSVAHRLWPELTLVSAIAGGSFVTYIPKLQYFLGDKIHIGSSVYAASEGLFGINKWMSSRTSAYSLQTNSIFFEFIPIANADNPKCTLLAEEIKANEVYEIIVTTSDGFYRYRMGDFIKVLEEADANEPPVIDVIGRKNIIGNVFGERVTEYQLTAAISASMGPNGPWNQYSLQDYLVTIDMKSIPPRYQLWVEGSPNVHAGGSDMLTEGGLFIEKQLAEMNMAYDTFRDQNMIGPLSVMEVAAGTFAVLISTLRQKSFVNESQLKIPRITANSQLIEILESSKVKI